MVYLPPELHTLSETELQLRAEKPFANPQLTKESIKQREKQDMATSPWAVSPQQIHLGRGAGSAEEAGLWRGCTPTVLGGLREPAGSRWEALGINWPVHIPKTHSKRKC